MPPLVSRRAFRFFGLRPFFSTMREFWLGVLGSGLTYAVFWYQTTPAANVVLTAPAAPRQVVTAPVARKAVASATVRETLSPGAPAQAPWQASHGSNERDSASSQGALLNEQRPQGELERGAAQAFIEPLPAALPKTIERMAELQRIAADPNALATRVQAMETDEAELAELRAFAERFVELPPDRVQRHVPSTSRSADSQ